MAAWKVQARRVCNIPKFGGGGIAMQHGASVSSRALTQACVTYGFVFGAVLLEERGRELQQHGVLFCSSGGPAQESTDGSNYYRHTLTLSISLLNISPLSFSGLC